jgi:hypothetical protein
MWTRIKATISNIKTALAILGWLGLSAWIGTIATTAGAAAWAVITGVSTPLVIMAVFCTLVAGAYLGLLPMAYRVLLRAQDSAPRQRPDPEIWRHVPRLQLYEAACLLADVEPNVPTVSMPGDANGWYRALVEAIRSGELKRVPTAFDSQHTFPGMGYIPYEETVITLIDLRSFAANRDARRAFLSNS